MLLRVFCLTEVGIWTLDYHCYIFQTKQHSINFDDIKKLYINNKDLFDKESPKILVNNNYYVSPRDVFKSDLQNKDLFIW